MAHRCSLRNSHSVHSSLVHCESHCSWGCQAFDDVFSFNALANCGFNLPLFIDLGIGFGSCQNFYFRPRQNSCYEHDQFNQRSQATEFRTHGHSIFSGHFFRLRKFFDPSLVGCAMDLNPISSQQKGQIVVESVLLLVVMVAVMTLVINGLKKMNYVESLTFSPWARISGMVECGVWEPCGVTLANGAGLHPSTRPLSSWPTPPSGSTGEE